MYFNFRGSYWGGCFFFIVIIIIIFPLSVFFRQLFLSLILLLPFTLLLVAMFVLVSLDSKIAYCIFSLNFFRYNVLALFLNGWNLIP